MSLIAFLATFVIIFPAELPDKSMIASVVLATRLPSLPVWTGLATAFLVHVVIAVAAGSIVSFLPHRVVAGIVTAFFVIGACILLFGKSGDVEEEAPTVNTKDRSFFGVASASFLIIFVSEWGDLTQIATINLAAKYGAPIAVGAGAVAALWAVTGLGVLLGKKLINLVPLRLVQRIAGLVLLAFAIWSAVDFAKG